MRKILIFGNSGAGKSTLSKKLSVDENLAHLDLDTLAFNKDSSTERRDIKHSLREVNIFLKENDRWVIEGGYADILAELLSHANEIIYLDLPAKTCQENARKRQWEPHKYASKEAQDANLDMLLNWILDYYSRVDAFSSISHNNLYAQFSGKKKRITQNQIVT